ncbi:hypothetical protein M422DRAFT_39148 [Sphaerobolus stellatus SS14]|uniref:Uncharacterized protein n=1 Tax=Sphaerobolus stellatus (strain SS14) TaxID=990650 RepID=A0A0C9UGG3_SPHS4|nr:hypothetical protein M422DRAFT_39148 [Sphaerobolus stellatus SS14]
MLLPLQPLTHLAGLMRYHDPDSHEGFNTLCGLAGLRSLECVEVAKEGNVPVPIKNLEEQGHEQRCIRLLREVDGGFGGYVEAACVSSIMWGGFFHGFGGSA